MFVKANEGILQIIEVQGENSKRMLTTDFLRGNPVQAGLVLE